ncbi:MAG: hypothetical protein HYV38_02505 [Candidatus Levybacteria bacterium]|nr:hypothetical protein [Candidatus Levybacteria bacterium]
MGVIKPPWVSEKWFNRTPFNYCDHFGDKERLATKCRICKDEIDRLERYKKEGKDPYDMKNVFEDLGKDLALAMAMVTKKAKEMGIDLDNLPDEEDEAPPHESYPIFNTVGKYGNKIEGASKELKIIPIDTDTKLVLKAVDAFSHSRHYVVAKIGRVLSSRWEEAKDPDDDLDDSKTSAFLAYIAIDRNSRAFLALAEHKPLNSMKVKHLKLAKLSLELCELIKEEFFPDERLEYEEFGYNDF